MIRINGRPYGWSTDLAALQIPSRHCSGLHYEHKTAERLDRDEPRENPAQWKRAALECAFIEMLPEQISEAQFARRMREFDAVLVLHKRHGTRGFEAEEAQAVLDMLDERSRKSGGTYKEKEPVRVEAMLTHGLLRRGNLGRLSVADVMLALFAAHRLAVKDGGEN